MRVIAACAFACLIALSGAPAVYAAEPEGCPRLLASRPLITHASLRADEMRLTFVGHATFLMETPAGLRVATDYNDYVRPSVLPHAITMNRAHSTHFTHNPDSSIEHVLRGWNPQGGSAAHDVVISDMRIRNVVTNIRDFSGGTDYAGNSIFVFEAAQICVAHLGHLHHKLTPEHIRSLGRIDVVLAPVDGGYTMSTPDMLDAIQSIGPQLVIPMHFFSQTSLQRFLVQAGKRFDVAQSDSATIVLNRERLPLRTKVLALPGR